MITAEQLSHYLNLGSTILVQTEYDHVFLQAWERHHDNFLIIEDAIQRSAYACKDEQTYLYTSRTGTVFSQLHPKSIGDKPLWKNSWFPDEDDLPIYKPESDIHGLIEDVLDKSHYLEPDSDRDRHQCTYCFSYAKNKYEKNHDEWGSTIEHEEYCPILKARRLQDYFAKFTY